MTFRDELGDAINQVLDQQPFVLEAQWGDGSRTLEIVPEAQALVRLQVKIQELLEAAEAVDEAMAEGE